MTPFEALRGNMDAGVNNHLGDTISIEFRDGTTATRIGFVITSADAASVGGLDPMQQNPSIKIDRAQLPETPAAVRRLSTAKLDGWYRMGPGVDADDRNAYLRDLQKAP